MFRAHPDGRQRRRWRWLERLLLIVGLSLVGYYTFVAGEAALYQAIENRELDKILASTRADPPNSAAPIGARRPPSRPSTILPPLAGSTIGRIEIPRLGVSTVIRAGADAKTLRRAVGYIPGTALPGAGGNVGLAGHRDTFFKQLRNIQSNDEVRIVTPLGTYRFRVQDTRVVEPRDTWVLNPTDVSTLTLVTCYPFTFVGSAPQRFIVRAREIPHPAAS